MALDSVTTARSLTIAWKCAAKHSAFATDLHNKRGASPGLISISESCLQRQRRAQSTRLAQELFPVPRLPLITTDNAVNHIYITSRDMSDASSSAATSHIRDDEARYAARLRAQKKKDRDTFNTVRIHLLNDLMRNLDVLIYAELSTLYYLDCFIFRLLIRCAVQFMFLTPKPPLFPSPPKPEPFIGAIVGTNLFCLILHIFSVAPEAGEGTRFYLHGSLIIDFIGQRGPTSKLLLVILDLLVLLLQLIHLSALVISRKLKDELHGGRTAVVQDLDSEERGVRRSVELANESTQESVELQSLNQDGTRQFTEDDDGRSDSIMLDAFRNGQIVLADLNILRTVKEQVLLFHKTPPEARRNALSAHLSDRIARFRALTGRTIIR